MESAEACVTTHLPKRAAPKTDDAKASARPSPILRRRNVAQGILSLKRQERRRVEEHVGSTKQSVTRVEAEWPMVQILVAVAVIQLGFSAGYN